MTVVIGIGHGDTGQHLEVETIFKEPLERDEEGFFVVERHEYYIRDSRSDQRIKIVWPEALLRVLERELAVNGMYAGVHSESHD